MHPQIFDRYEFIKSAMLTGMPEEQAKVIAAYVQEVHSTEDRSLATKADIQGLAEDIQQLDSRMDGIERRMDGLENKIESVHAELEYKIDSLRNELNGKIDLVQSTLEKAIEASKVDLLKWYVGVAIFQTTTMIGAIVALVKMLH